jgi:hypothetical protein
VISVDADTMRMFDAVRPDAWEWTLLRRTPR